MKRGRREPELDIIWTPVGSLCFFVCLHLQFQNNNNYMNMAEANGALLAAGDVSMLYFFFFLFCYIFKFPLAQMEIQPNANILSDTNAGKYSGEDRPLGIQFCIKVAKSHT